MLHNLKKTEFSEKVYILGENVFSIMRLKYVKWLIYVDA